MMKKFLGSYGKRVNRSWVSFEKPKQDGTFKLASGRLFSGYSDYPWFGWGYIHLFYRLFPLTFPTVAILAFSFVDFALTYSDHKR